MEPHQQQQQEAISSPMLPTTTLPFKVRLVNDDGGNVHHDNTIFEFLEDPTTSSALTAEKCSVPLKTVIRQYLGSSFGRTVPAKQLYLILGRLRCLNFALSRYNEGVLNPTPVFLQYWRRRTLNQLSSFGFRMQNALQPISIFGLSELIQAMERLYEEQIRTAHELIASGLINFDALCELYRPDVPVQGRTGNLAGHPGIFMVTDYYFEERRSLLGMEKSFHWTMDFVATMGEHFALISFTEVSSGWIGARARPQSELTYIPVKNGVEHDAFQERGERYVRYGSGVRGGKFLAYTPNTFFLHGRSSLQSGSSSSLSRSNSSLLPTGGRIMVDVARGIALGHHPTHFPDEASNALIQFAGRYHRWRNANAGKDPSHEETMTLWDTIPPELIIYCWPALVGFSFSAKAWGHVLVSGLELIQFHEQAFDKLVLSEERKQLIRALIRFGGDAGTDDIVGGKSGGTIILLHGPPGVGKTLTAEAIAEVLHRPLYYVTMGELGVEPQEMERRLSDVLDLCAGWNALTLLDEADVFLETRTTNDLLRNTLVCVMLRLLEYHPGLLFLTTNRVRSFDPAIESRVTVALRYDSLDVDARVQIWKNLLRQVTETAVAPDVSYDELGKHVLNGRQIKNAVRLALALARERQSDITASVLKATIEITSLGREEMKVDDSWKE